MGLPFNLDSTQRPLTRPGHGEDDRIRAFLDFGGSGDAALGSCRMETREPLAAGDGSIAIIPQERGISSKRESSSRVIRSLALVDTARRYYRLNILVRTSD
ncbi:hypothetical protein JTE90_006443 [Oedothorax gibbosus]|uniref:Uncharacterized protein n=1 Tax=Oedothorax gibbosus TaxID=931172 RepID=A0AAV6TDT7_9ARAC|nr:hypothetical protein JTE90_006443 [Oedothorax gibbosus]